MGLLAWLDACLPTLKSSLLMSERREMQHLHCQQFSWRTFLYAYIFMMIETESRHKLVDFLCHGACVQINGRSARMHK